MYRRFSAGTREEEEPFDQAPDETCVPFVLVYSTRLVVSLRIGDRQVKEDRREIVTSMRVVPSRALR